MIFVGGIHGVGKSTFAEYVKEATGINTYTASSLIKNETRVDQSINKKVANIQENQNILTRAVQNIQKTDIFFLLDGHYCLTNEDSTIARVPFETFEQLSPKALIILTAKPLQIQQRLFSRDGSKLEIDFIKNFQNEELTYAHEIASKLNVEIFSMEQSDDCEESIQFIRSFKDEV